MTHEGTCDICGYSSVKHSTLPDGHLVQTGEIVGVASVPGFPVSLAWCEACLVRGVIPLFCVEATVCDVELDLDIYGTLKRHGLAVVQNICADWFLEAITYIGPPPHDGQTTSGPGRYMTVKEWLFLSYKKVAQGA